MLINFFRRLRSSKLIGRLVLLLIVILFIPIPLSFGQPDGSENVEPVANIKLDQSRHSSSNSVMVLEPVYFSGEDSYDPNPGDELTYFWDLGNGKTSHDISPNTIYNIVGEYIVTLSVHDGSLSDVSNLTIFMISEGGHHPVANILPKSDKDAQGDHYANVSEPISFLATDSYDPDGFQLNYEWNFGDGKKSFGEIVIHEFETDGSFNVTLIVTDEELLEDSDSIIFKIQPTGSGTSKNNGDDTPDESIRSNILLFGIVIVLIITLLTIWLVLGYLRKRARKQEKRTVPAATAKAAHIHVHTAQVKPARSRSRSAVESQVVPVTQPVTKTTKSKRAAEGLKKDYLRKRLHDEYKKVDDDMKKEFEDLGIEL